MKKNKQKNTHIDFVMKMYQSLVQMKEAIDGMDPYHWNRMHFIQHIVICPLQGK